MNNQSGPDGCTEQTSGLARGTPTRTIRAHGSFMRTCAWGLARARILYTNTPPGIHYFT